MNKLEKLHLDVIEEEKAVLDKCEIEEGITWVVDKKQSSTKSAKITTDVAIKFAEWVDNKNYRQASISFFKSLFDKKGKTTKELFEEFINNHYK